VEKYGRAREGTDDDRTQCMHFACWMTKITDTHSSIYHIAFPLQQWFPECTLMLRYMYMACRVKLDPQ
jgi:hypothetical protein